MSNDKLPTVKEFFDLRAPTILTDKWDKELFAKLCTEYGELTGTRALSEIAYSTDINKYSLEERLAAFDEKQRIRGDNDIESAHLTKIMRDMVVGFYNTLKEDSEAK